MRGPGRWGWALPRPRRRRCKTPPRRRAPLRFAEGPRRASAWTSTLSPDRASGRGSLGPPRRSSKGPERSAGRTAGSVRPAPEDLELGADARPDDPPVLVEAGRPAGIVVVELLDQLVGDVHGV